MRKLKGGKRFLVLLFVFMLVSSPVAGFGMSWFTHKVNPPMGRVVIDRLNMNVSLDASGNEGVLAVSQMYAVDGQSGGGYYREEFDLVVVGAENYRNDGCYVRLRSGDTSTSREQLYWDKDKNGLWEPLPRLSFYDQQGMVQSYYYIPALLHTGDRVKLQYVLKDGFSGNPSWECQYVQESNNASILKWNVRIEEDGTVSPFDGSLFVAGPVYEGEAPWDIQVIPPATPTQLEGGMEDANQAAGDGGLSDDGIEDQTEGPLEETISGNEDGDVPIGGEESPDPASDGSKGDGDVSGILEENPSSIPPDAENEPPAVLPESW